MKLNKKIIGLVIAGVVAIGIGFSIGNNQYDDEPKEEVKSEQVMTTEKTDEEILTSATEEELTEATEKTLKENFDTSKYDVKVDNYDNTLVITISIIGSDFRNLSQDNINTLVEEYGLDEKMDKLADMIHDIWVLSGKDKDITVGLFDDVSTLIYSTSSNN